MTLRLALLTKKIVSSSTAQLETQVSNPPTLWSQLDPLSQQKLAQHLARLIRGILLQPNNLEGNDHERS
jgi:hypothetical protein